MEFGMNSVRKNKKAKLSVMSLELSVMSLEFNKSLKPIAALWAAPA